MPLRPNLSSFKIDQSLINENAHFQTMVNRLMEKQRCLLDQIDELGAVINAKDFEVAELKRTNDKYKCQLQSVGQEATKDVEVKQLKMLLAAKSLKSKNAEFGQSDKLVEENQKLVLENLDLKEKLQKYLTMVVERDTMIGDLRDIQKVKQARIEALENAKCSASNKVIAADIDLHDVIVMNQKVMEENKNRIQLLTEQNQEIADQLEQELQTKQQLEEKVGLLDKEVKSLKFVKLNNQKKLAQLTDQKDSVLALNNRIFDLKESAAELEEEKVQLKSKNANLESQIAAHSEQFLNLQQDLAQKEREHQKIVEQFSDKLKSETTKYALEKSGTQAKINQMETERADLSKQNQQLSRQQEKLVVQLESIQRGLNESIFKLGQQQLKIKDLEAEIRAKDSEMQRIQNARKESDSNLQIQAQIQIAAAKSDENAFLLKQISEQELKFLVLKAQHDKDKEALRTSDQKFDELSKECEALKKKVEIITELNQQSKLINDKLTSDLIGLKSEKAKLVNELQDRNYQSKQVKELTEKLSASELKISNLKEMLNQMEQRLVQSNILVDSLKQQLDYDTLAMQGMPDNVQDLQKLLLRQQRLNDNLIQSVNNLNKQISTLKSSKMPQLLEPEVLDRSIRSKTSGVKHNPCSFFNNQQYQLNVYLNDGLPSCVSSNGGDSSNADDVQKQINWLKLQLAEKDQLSAKQSQKIELLQNKLMCQSLASQTEELI